MATPEQFRRRGRWTLILGTLIAALALGAVAYADQVNPDADVVAPGDQNTLTLPATTKLTVLTPQASFVLKCNGNNHVDNAQSVTITFAAVGPGGSTLPAGGTGATLSATDASVGATGGTDPGVPASWPDDGNNCGGGGGPPDLPDNGNATVTIGAPSVLGGPYNYSVKWNAGVTPAGSNDSNSLNSNVNLTYTVNVNPRPPSNLNATANGASQINLTWTASPDAADITDYKVIRTKTVGGATTTLTAAKNATSFNDTGLVASSEYCYTIRAHFNNGTDFFSTSVGPACATTAGLVVDTDGDGVPDATDNCPSVANPGQQNNDGDALGDACDPDDDNDGVADGADNCQFTANSGQQNNDGDALGDACDPDDDNDTVADGTDNCPLTANADQANADGDSQGDACDADDDNDGVADGADNCQFTANADQVDTDGDGLGNACDADDDGDGVLDGDDNCPLTQNADQTDTDGDGQGDACDADNDNDGVPDASDNCPSVANPTQADADGDGLGNACDTNSYAPAVGTAASDANGNEGATLTTSGSFTDQDGNGTLTITKQSGDGTVTPNGNGTWSWSLPTTDNGSGSVTVKASDGEHTDATDTFSWSAANVAPEVTLSGLDSANEGDTVSYSYTFTDPGADSWTHTSSCGANGQKSDDTFSEATKSGSFKCKWTDNFNDEAVSATVNDDDTGTDTDTISVDIANVAPDVTLTTKPASGNEGSTLSYAYSFTDPGADDWTHTTTCGANGQKSDDTFSEASKSGSFKCTWSDNYDDENVSAKVDDDDTGTDTDSVLVDIANVAPTINGFLVSPTSGTGCIGGNLVTVSFTVSDPADNTHDPITGSITWGDTNSTSISGRSISQSHTYSPGSYSLQAGVNDGDGGTAGKTQAISFLYATSGILQPINLTGPRSAFKLGSTIPVKIKVTDCHGASVSGLTLKVKLQQLDSSANPVNETAEYSVPDEGDTMRYDSPGGQYIYNLSTKRTTLLPSGALTAGSYRVTVYGASIASASADFDAK